jgi:hypothetical protein
MFDFLTMGKAEPKAGLLKGQLIFIIKYLTSFQKLGGYFEVHSSIYQGVVVNILATLPL